MSKATATSSVRRGPQASLRPLRKRTGLALAVAAGALVSSQVVTPDSARAGWPPPANATAADMANPANWPNDPGYGYTATDHGQWNYYSFMITPNMARPEETATGMSTDLAWRITQGDPRVIIAITDSGIKWDEDDIIEAAYLNHKELKNHRPDNLGVACGNLDPAHYPGDMPADLAGFDCNGDGILTVADYANTNALTPPMSMGHPLGDRNGNGKLDAGDLIYNFSDGTDDDQNGYVDDISGWDFMKDDNDPYDDTRYGHGTGEARDSMSRANNNIGTAGGCPNCRLLPLRVGDSFITDVTDFGQAVDYAADMHVRILQSALGTVNNNAFAQKAIDYGWSKGMLFITSMADENSRHHNMPTVSNHTLPVHAIEYNGDSLQTASTFVDYHPCSNFGGQNFLSSAGRGCSSEATGQLSGIAGLVMSQGYDMGLTGGEAQQVLMMSADDIDVPESQKPDSIYRWSQKGFDQRFGYGRVNANRAVEMVRDGKIPPVVDITSPTWFSVLYKDQVTAPVDIQGVISAKRAMSFDYTAEWAPGVQPLDGAFVKFAGASNIDAKTVIGGTSGPIASLDVRSIDPTSEADIDSPLGENRYTITVRIRAVAHYAPPIGDVAGELRRTYYVHSDPDLLKGFPIFIGSGGEGSPKMADLDGDNVRELLYPTAGGELHVYKMTDAGPKELPGFPFKADRADGLKDQPPPGVPRYLDAPGYQPGAVDPDVGLESLSTNAPAIGDVDGDGKPEIVVTSYAGTIYVLGADGQAKPGWPKRLPEVPSCSLDASKPTPQPCMGEDSHIARGAFGAPVLEDMNGDGKLDIIQAAFDGKIYVFDKDAKLVDGYPVEIAYSGPLSASQPTNRIFTTPAVADFDGDGTPDLLVGSSQKLGEGGGSGAIYLVNGKGTKAQKLIFPNWPITMTSLNLFPLVAEGITNAGVVGHVDGKLLAIQHGNASPPLMLPLDPGVQAKLNQTPENALPQRADPNDPTRTVKGVDLTSIYGPLTKAPKPDTMLPLFSQPSMGDMDQDGVPDVIASGGSLTLAQSLQSSTSSRGANLLAMWSGKTGAMMPASPMVLEDFTFLNSSAVADITNDGYPEALIGSGGYYLHAIDACGREPTGWPKFTGQWIIPTPSVGDIDGDGKLDVAVGTRDGWLYAWRTEGSVNSLVEWESYHHDNRNTGNYDVKLDQGGSTHPAPLTVDMCQAPVVPGGGPKYGIAGGCNCEIASEPSRAPAGLCFVVAGVAAAFGARRRKRS